MTTTRKIATRRVDFDDLPPAIMPADVYQTLDKYDHLGTLEDRIREFHAVGVTHYGWGDPTNVFIDCYGDGSRWVTFWAYEDRTEVRWCLDEPEPDR